MIIRLARLDDIPALEALIEQSVMGLQQNEYPLEQRQGALGTVFGIDWLLIEDSTYFVVEDPGRGTIGPCGGWSKRNTLCSSGHSGVK